MPRLSIVVPCAQDARLFEATLASVLQNRPDDCEVLVVQPRRYDDPYGLKDEVRFVETAAHLGVIDLANAGMEQASAELVHVLSCATEVTEGWLQPVLRHFEDDTVGCVAPLVVTKSHPSQVISRGVHYGHGGVRQVVRVSPQRSNWREVFSPTFAAGIYRRQAVLRAGGFRAEFGCEYADIDLGLSLRAAGYRCVHEEQSVVTCESEPEAVELSVTNGRAAEQVFWRHAAGASWAELFVRHPLVCFAECACHVYRPQIWAQTWGRLLGWLTRRHVPSPRLSPAATPSGEVLRTVPHGVRPGQPTGHRQSQAAA